MNEGREGGGAGDRRRRTTKRRGGGEVMKDRMEEGKRLRKGRRGRKD
jgi:hypothetical protein